MEEIAPLLLVAMASLRGALMGNQGMFFERISLTAC